MRPQLVNAYPVHGLSSRPSAREILQVADAVLASGADRTTSFAYAVAWTQHTDGVQMISCCALLQLLLGNMGRPGGGIMALRGHAAIQGSTDVPTLYHSIHGYMSHPSALKKHATLRDYLTTETQPTGYWANQPKFMVSYLKSMYGDPPRRTMTTDSSGIQRSWATIRTSRRWPRWPRERSGECSASGRTRRRR
jgi:anaerobic selenocysteine-containing dehydrogenase